MPLRFYRSILFPLVLLFAGIPLSAQAPSTDVPQMANAVTVCYEANSCVVTGTNCPSLTYQFGTNTAPGGWGPTFISPTFPLTVSYSSANLALAPQDPLPNVAKELDAQQMSVACQVNYTDSTGPHTANIPALVPPPPPPVAPPTNLASLAWALIQSATTPTSGYVNEIQFTCVGVANAAILPPGVTLPTYGTPPLACVLAVIQVATAPVVPPTPAPPANASK